MSRFWDKVVLVTGAATGIGRATALAFAREGASVMIGDIDPRSAETVAAIEAAGGCAAFHRTDVADSAEVDALVAASVAQFGGLHAAFNNAGILPPPAPFHLMSDEAFDRTIAVDLRGVFLCMRAEIRHFLAHGGGCIVNTASVGGVIADPGMAPYIAAKHGVVGLTRAAAVDYGAQGIRVNAIGPGFVRTPMTEEWAQSEEFRRAFFANNVSGRYAEPEEIAGTVLHLCSDAASFINGALFLVDGGQTAH